MDPKKLVMSCLETMMAILMFIIMIGAVVMVFIGFAHAAPRVQQSRVLTVVLTHEDLPVCSPSAVAMVVERARTQMRPAARVTGPVIEMHHPFPTLSGLHQRYELARALKSYIKSLPRFKWRRVHLLAPPLVGPRGELYSWGLAGGNCESNAVTVSSCLERNDLGQNRLPASYVAMAHEILHGLGARHLAGRDNIMSLDPMPLAEKYGIMPVSKRTIEQVRKCRAD